MKFLHPCLLALILLVSALHATPIPVKSFIKNAAGITLRMATVLDGFAYYYVVTAVFSAGESVNFLEDDVCTARDPVRSPGLDRLGLLPPLRK